MELRRFSHLIDLARVDILIDCYYAWPCVLIDHVLDGRFEFTIEGKRLVKKLPHEHAEGVGVHLGCWVVSLLGLSEALGRRPNVHRSVAEEHLGVSLEVAHFELSYTHLRCFFVVMEFYEHIVRIQTTMVDRRA